MTDYNTLARLVNGVVRNLNLETSGNVLVVDGLRATTGVSVGTSGSNSTLTKALIDLLNTSKNAYDAGLTYADDTITSTDHTGDTSLFFVGLTSAPVIQTIKDALTAGSIWNVKDNTGVIWTFALKSGQSADNAVVYDSGNGWTSLVSTYLDITKAAATETDWFDWSDFSTNGEWVLDNPNGFSYTGGPTASANKLIKASSTGYLDPSFIGAGVIDATKLAASVAGAGLTGGGGTALAVGAGDGISVATDAVAVDSTVMRNNADQTMTVNSTIQYHAGTVVAAATDLTTKAYVDAVAAGLAVHAPVRVATVAEWLAANIVYDNGVSGVGATITNNGTQAALEIDGVTVSAANGGDRVLVKDQSNATGGDAAYNGIYVVTNVGSGSTNWVLTRAADYDNSPVGEISDGDFVLVQEGSANAHKSYVQTQPWPTGSTVGTTDVVFTQFANLGTVTLQNAYSAGNTITTASSNSVVITGSESLKIQATLGLDMTNKTITTTTTDTDVVVKTNGTGGFAVSNGTYKVTTKISGSQTADYSLTLPVDDGTPNQVLATNGTGVLSWVDNGVPTAGDGIDIAANVVSVDLYANGGLKFVGTGGSGELAVESTPKSMIHTFTAGETFAAGTTYLVRIGTGGKIFKADNDATTNTYYNVIGAVRLVSQVLANEPLIEGVQLFGLVTCTAATFESSDIGKVVFLGTSGAPTVTAPTAANTAVYACGIVTGTAEFLLQGLHMRGIN